MVVVVGLAVRAVRLTRIPPRLPAVPAELTTRAAIPGAFPPTMMRVEVDGTPCREMHVDGGCSAQVFPYPASMLRAAKEVGREMRASRGGRVSVIRDPPLAPPWLAVERRAISVAGLATASLIHDRGMGDPYRICPTAQRDGVDSNLAHIEPESTYPSKMEGFETAHVVKLTSTAWPWPVPGIPGRSCRQGW